MFLLSRLQNLVIQQASRVGVAHGGAAERGGAGRDAYRTVCPRATVPRTFQGKDERLLERFSSSMTKTTSNLIKKKNEFLTRRFSTGRKALLFLCCSRVCRSLHVCIKILRPRTYSDYVCTYFLFKACHRVQKTTRETKNILLFLRTTAVFLNHSGQQQFCQDTPSMKMVVSLLSSPKPEHTKGGSGRSAQRGGGAGSVRAGRRQNSPSRKQGSLVLVKAS